MPAPEQSYYPRCTLRLILRFDEFGNDSHLKLAAPKATTKNLDGLSVARSPLVASIDPTAPPGTTRYVLSFPGQAPAAGGPQAQTSSDDGYTFDVTVIPKSASWMQNGIQHASTLNASIKYIDCPIDPRLVRSVGVEMLLGCVTEDAFVLSNTKPGGVVIPPTYTGPNGETRTNLRFQGFATKFKTAWGKGEPLITLDAQDNSVLLHNQEMSPRVPLSMVKPIDHAVADFLANYVQLAGLTIQYLPVSDTPPVLATILSGTAFRPNLGPMMSKNGGASKMSIWDYLTDVCGSAALTIRMDGTSLIIQGARALLTSAPAPRSDDPFKGRSVDGQSFPYRRYIYGQNIETMEIERNFGKKAVANIEVRSVSTERKTVCVGRFPQPKDRQVYALPGNTTPDQKWSVYNVPGIKDQDTLTKIAQGIYEQIGRQELGVELKTKNLASFGGSNSDPDILDMKVGDTFELLVDRTKDGVNSLTAIELALSAQASNAALMLQLGFSQAFAYASAKAYTNAAFTTTYRLKTMKIDWSEHGVTLAINGANYIEVRADKLLPGGLETSNTAMQPATGAK